MRLSPDGLGVLTNPNNPPDRAVAADTACTVTTALLVLLALLFGRSVYLDVALVYGVLTFIGLVSIARYLEKGI